MENDVKGWEEKLEKILKGCETCKAKMCSLCPNGQMKSTLRKKIKANQKEENPSKGSVFFKSLLKYLSGSS